MRALSDRSDGFLDLEENRLETPTMAGYRAGMSSSGVIGRKLGAVLGVDRELPEQMDSALRQLQGRLGRSR